MVPTPTSASVSIFLLTLQTSSPLRKLKYLWTLVLVKKCAISVTSKIIYFLFVFLFWYTIYYTYNEVEGDGDVDGPHLQRPVS